MVDEAFLAEIGTPYRDVQDNLVVSCMADMLQRPIKVFSFDPESKSVEENTFHPHRKVSAELILGHIKDKYFVPCKYKQKQKKRANQSFMDMFIKRPKQGTEKSTVGAPQATSPTTNDTCVSDDVPPPTPGSEQPSATSCDTRVRDDGRPPTAGSERPSATSGDTRVSDDGPPPTPGSEQSSAPPCAQRPHRQLGLDCSREPVCSSNPEV
jgi:hypothetical protein